MGCLSPAGGGRGVDTAIARSEATWQSVTKVSLANYSVVGALCVYSYVFCIV